MSLNENNDGGAVKPFVSVVIPTYNRGNHLRQTIGSLFAQDYPKDRYEVIVVDNSSTDDTGEVIAELQKGAPCALSYFVKEPEGPGPARNLGVEKAAGEIIAFIDSDCIADSNWLGAGTSLISGEVALVQGRTLPDPSVPWGLFSRSVRIEEKSDIYECCNMFYSKEAIESVGGFSGIFDKTNFVFGKYLGGEDMDLAYRVMRKGYRSDFTPDALIFHEVTRQRASGWMLDWYLMSWPLMVKLHPECRSQLFMRYFLSRAHLFFLLALLAICAGIVQPVFFLLALPYVVYCAFMPGKSWRGAMKLLRAVVCFPRDAASVALLVAGSLKHRALVL